MKSEGEREKKRREEGTGWTGRERGRWRRKVDDKAVRKSD
jgi:hypothetical protein